MSVPKWMTKRSGVIYAGSGLNQKKNQQEITANETRISKKSQQMEHGKRRQGERSYIKEFVDRRHGSAALSGRRHRRRQQRRRRRRRRCRWSRQLLRDGKELRRQRVLGRQRRRRQLIRRHRQSVDAFHAATAVPLGEKSKLNKMKFRKNQNEIRRDRKEQNRYIAKKDEMRKKTQSWNENKKI